MKAFMNIPPLLLLCASAWVVNSTPVAEPMDPGTDVYDAKFEVELPPGMSLLKTKSNNGSGGSGTDDLGTEVSGDVVHEIFGRCATSVSSAWTYDAKSALLNLSEHGGTCIQRVEPDGCTEIKRRGTARILICGIPGNYLECSDAATWLIGVIVDRCTKRNRVEGMITISGDDKQEELYLKIVRS